VKKEVEAVALYKVVESDEFEGEVRLSQRVY